jgi:Ricin-type beta-trefoil lectin domain
VLTTCTSTVRQQWSYGTGGLLHSLADSELCLDSRLGFSVRLESCDDTSRHEFVRYDLTLQGTLLPRGAAGLALTPASGDDGAGLVLKRRTDEAAQRWFIDGSVESLRIESIFGVKEDSPS